MNASDMNPDLLRNHRINWLEYSFTTAGVSHQEDVLFDSPPPIAAYFLIGDGVGDVAAGI